MLQKRGLFKRDHDNKIRIAHLTELISTGRVHPDFNWYCASLNSDYMRQVKSE